MDDQGDKLLAAALMLAQYELLQGSRVGFSGSPSEGRRWSRHVSGETAILLARTPDCYADGNAHQLFINSRLHLIYPSIRTRKRSPFSSPGWKSIPWSLHPKDPKNELLDILVEIPTVLEDLDELQDCPSDQTERHMSLRCALEMKCWLHDFQLQRWASTSGSSTINFVESLILSREPEFSMPSSEDFAIAHLGLIYWTTCLILYQNLTNLSQQNYLPERTEPRQYCRKIMQAMPHFQRPNVGMFFLNMTGFSAVVVSRFLDRHDPPDTLSEERRIFMAAFRGKYRRQIGNNLEQFSAVSPWRNAKWKSSKPYQIQGIVERFYD